MDKFLKDEEIEEIAKEFGIDSATIKAVKEVESKGSGFLPSGKAKILFEGHIFWKQLLANRKNPKDYLANNLDIIYPSWVKDFYKGGEKEYDRLVRAEKIDKDAAWKSTSFGLFQIMGFNYKAAGYNSIIEFVTAQQESEKEQLKAFANFVKNNNLIGYLKEKNWVEFAKKYNGPAYVQNKYDVLLEKAYNKYHVDVKPVVKPIEVKTDVKVQPKVDIKKS